VSVLAKGNLYLLGPFLPVYSYRWGQLTVAAAGEMLNEINHSQPNPTKATKVG